MVQAIERGDRLANEPTIPDFLYEKMLGCWHAVPGKRPSFERLNDNFLIAAKVLAA